MEGNPRTDSGMDLDLNQEPVDDPFGSALGLGSLLNELESAHVRIEDRIRQLEAVTARARHRQRWRQLRNSFETTSNTIEPLLRNVDHDRGSHWHDGEGSGRAEGNVERGKGCKRDSSHLVARALEKGSEVKKKRQEDGGNFFDCNICLNIAKEPILTCCGHLFCWLCFYKLPYAYSTSKECPVCCGEVTDSTIVPIYGNGDSSKQSKLESRVMVPPRPKAQRIESVRQLHLAQGISHIPVTEVLRRIRTSIGAISITPEHEASGGADLHPGSSSQEVPTVESASVRERRRLRARQFTRVLSESAASLSSISSALNSAERLVEDLDTYINHRILQRSAAQFLSTVDGDLLTRDGAISTAEHRIPEHIVSLVPVASSSRTNYTSDNFQPMENPTPSSIDEFNQTRARSSPSSRRRVVRVGFARVLDMGDETSHETGSRRM